MGYDGRAVANFILDYCEKNKRDVTNLSLQKIIFFCHAWSLIDLDKPLIKQKFEAWEYGPVLQYIYHEFKSFDRSPITTRAKKINLDTGHSEVVEYDFDDQTQNLLSRVIDFYSRLPAGYLVELSHVKGGPWDRVWNHEGLVNPGMKIDHEDIARYYSRVNKPYVAQ